MKTWTENEVALLIEIYPRSTNAELQAMFPNKSPLAIYKKAYKMGFRKMPDIVFCNKSQARSGENASNWKGGRRTTHKGYVQVLSPNHPRADSCGYVMEHILVWENATGFPVPNGFCIHHIDRNKKNNDISNLCLMTHGTHTKLHHTGAKRTEETKSKISESKKGK